jgi:NAD(P)-dependent dehydrogenase (short-subunit alcohol dehydrogenase family)
MNIDGLAAIVTGGGTGIGGAIAEALAAAGAKCSLLGRRPDVVEKKAEEIGGRGISCDVSDYAAVEHAFGKARDAFGPCRVLVNSAGIAPLGETLLLPDGNPLPQQKFDAVVNVNLNGAFNAMRLAAADMARLDPLDDGSRGLIINILTLASLDGAAFCPAYVASKGGLGALTLALARELGRHAIRVMGIAPGPIRTPMAEAEVPEEMMEAAVETMPFPRYWAEPTVVADLASHIVANTFLNGEIIRCDAAARVPYHLEP